MAPRFQEHRRENLAGPLVHLQFSSLLILRRGTQGESSILQARLIYILALQWSQVPGRAPRTEFEASRGSPSFLNFEWRAAQDRLPDILYLCVFLS